MFWAKHFIGVYATKSFRYGLPEVFLVKCKKVGRTAPCPMHLRVKVPVKLLVLIGFEIFNSNNKQILITN